MITRIRLITLVFLLGFGLVLARLFYWQIIKGEELSRQARAQYQSGRVISAPRGNILSSDGGWLASRMEAWLVYASLPNLSEPPRDIANKLAPLFVEDPEDKEALLIEAERLTNLLSRKEVVWVPLKQKVSKEVREKIETYNLAGIGFEPQETRYYPEASTAAHLLGFVGKNSQGEDQGYFGLEGFYNLSLSGKPGFLARQRDARGIPILLGGATEISAIGGVDLVTHIDKTIQLIIERKLVEGIERYGASGGMVIVMNPKNGAVLGLSAYPSFDPARYSFFGDEFFRNPAVSDTFEPGSIFKVVIMASAFDAGAVKPDTRCDICTGPLKIDRYTIGTWNNQYHPDSTMVDVIVNSDNVGMAFVGQRLGAENLYQYLDKFGFGRITGIDLQGEATSSLRPKGKWSFVDVATASFGQGIAVTPIQMIKSVATIANGGVPTTPQVVDKLKGVGWEENIEPQLGERVISEVAAKQMTAIMVEAAERGEAKWTDIKGFKVAGKTGTAQIPIAGHYDTEKTIGSFVGFAPYDEPKFVMLVTLREPTSSPWASETAAPLWYSIARDLFVYLGIQPSN